MLQKGRELQLVLNWLRNRNFFYSWMNRRQVFHLTEFLTSGLDSQSAYNIIRFLRKLAQAGQAILCTVHQPNDSLFEQFDRLLLLEHGGRTVYFGEIGQDACVLRDYFKRNGAECPPRHNPAEFMLETIGAGSRPRVGHRDWADIWNDSPRIRGSKETNRSD